MSDDPIVLHVADGATWAEAERSGQPYAPPSLDDEGFVHCSTEAQIAGTLERVFAGADLAAHVVLVIDVRRLPPTTPVRWEAGEDAPDERFPHLHGPVPPAAVVEVRRPR